MLPPDSLGSCAYWPQAGMESQYDALLIGAAKASVLLPLSELLTKVGQSDPRAHGLPEDIQTLFKNHTVIKNNQVVKKFSFLILLLIRTYFFFCTGD